MAPTDATLLEQWTRGRDAEAFREIVDRYSMVAYATARRILGDPAMAEDVAQECFLKLVEAPAAAANLPAWLHRVATNLSLNAIRARKRRRENESRWRPPERAIADPAWEDVEALVDEAIEGLPSEWREPIVLHFLGGRTHEAVATAMGISKAAVAHRIERGIERIRAALRRRGIGVAPAILAGWLAARTAEAAPVGLIATLGKMALAGPKAAALSSTLVIGGLMKLYASIAAGILIAGACIFLLVRPGERDGVAPTGKEVGSGRPTAGREAEPPQAPPSAAEKPADPKEPGSAPDPLAEEEKEEPLASIAGSVVDESDAPVARAQVLVIFHEAEAEASGRSAEIRESSLMEESWYRKSHTLSATTDDRGAFRFERVPFSGRATVAAFAEGFATGMCEPRIDAGKPNEGLVVRLSAGKTLRGIVTGTGAGPVADAIVSIYQSWNKDEMWAWGTGVGTTDGSGRFSIGLPAKTDFCNLRVNSDSCGQDFFLEVPVAGEEVHLELRQKATLRGRIAREDGRAAFDCLVYLETKVPDPPLSIRRLGRRPILGHEARVDAEGRYEVRNLQPGFPYTAQVVGIGPEGPRGRPPLSTRTFFTLSPGEVKTWDVTITGAIVVRGTIRTERLKTPLPRARIGLRKDGAAIHEFSAEADEQGAYRCTISSGPGRYIVYARPAFVEWDEAADAIVERFGRAIDVRGGENLQVDLEVSEPIVLPIRVLDADGRPPESIRYELGFDALNGRHFSITTTDRLDAEGRMSMPLHFPVKEITLQVGAFTGGPMTEVRRFAYVPDTTIPEQTFLLYGSCDVAGAIVDAGGKPIGGKLFDVWVTYPDESTDLLAFQTDPEGRFDLKGQVRATVFTIRLRGEAGTWTSERLDGSAGAVDLGSVAPKPAEARPEGG